MTLRLYEVEFGITWWVSARDPLEALRLVHDVEKALGADSFDEVASITIDLVADARAKKLRFHDDDTDEVRSMLEEHNRSTEPRAVACSEW